MNNRTIFAAIAFIVALPLVYLMFGGFKTEEKRSFRGREIVDVSPADGVVTVPTKSENKNGAPMTARFKPAFLEKLTGIKPPNNNDLELSITSIAAESGSCNEDGTSPVGGGFEVAAMCASGDFTAAKFEKPTAVFVDNAERLIVLGNSGKNQARVFHGGMIASYLSPDMTQSDRKHEACIVRTVLDYLTGSSPDPERLCTLKTP